MAPARCFVKYVGRDDGQQVPDPHLRRRRNRAGPSGARCGAERHRRNGPYRRLPTTSARIQPSLSTPPSRSAPNSRQQDAWMNWGGGRELLARVLQGLQRSRHRSCGATGAQMGGWFRKEIKTVDDLKGPEVPHRRHRRTSDQSSVGGVAAADSRRRYLSGVGEGHDRRRRVGRPLRRPEARVQQDRAVLLLSWLVGRRRRSLPPTSIWRSGTSCPSLYKAVIGGRLCPGAKRGCSPSMTRRIPKLCASWRPPAPS